MSPEKLAAERERVAAAIRVLLNKVPRHVIDGGIGEVRKWKVAHATATKEVERRRVSLETLNRIHESLLEKK